MKRLLLFIAILSLLVTTVASADTITKYKGYSIVNVNVNGSNISSDVPAINMDGRTLLPLRKVSEALNSIVSWDSTTKTASVVKPQINIIFTETTDGVIASGPPTEIIPFWTEYEKYLSYVTISGLNEGKYNLSLGIYKNDQNNNPDFSSAIESVPIKEITSSGPNSPVLFSNAWDKLKITEAGIYSFIVSMEDEENQYRPMAIYSMELK